MALEPQFPDNMCPQRFTERRAPAQHAPPPSWENLNMPLFIGMQYSLQQVMRIATYPFGLVKTLQQARLAPGHPTYPDKITHLAPKQVLSKLVRSHGVTSCWRGNGVYLVASIPTTGMYLTSLEYTRWRLRDYGTVTAGLCAGATASISSQLVVVPAEVVSQRCCMQMPSSLGANVSLVQSVLKSEGIRGLYVGSKATLIAIPAFSAVWWASYTTSRKFILTNADTVGKNVVGALDRVAARLLPPVVMEVTDEHSSSPSAIGLATIGSSVAATTAAVGVTMPLDLYKTRVQLKEVPASQSLFTVLAAEARSHGMRSLWAGTKARWNSAVVSILWATFTYETLRNYCNRPG